MRRLISAVLGVSVLVLCGCTTTKQFARSDFRPPEGGYKMIVMRPDISVSLLTAGGMPEPREDWTDQARTNVLASLLAQQEKGGGSIKIAATREEAGGDTSQVSELERLHEAVGQSILLHKYTPGQELPTKKNVFDWTLGQSAIEFGKSTGYDYALFLYARDSFSSGGRVALQAVSMLGCAVGICYIPAGGQQVAFASLVDLKTGQVVWFNFLSSSIGDIRTPAGAEQMVDKLLDGMTPEGQESRKATASAKRRG
jgi:hypothetical protein